MNLNDYHRLTMATLPELLSNEHVKSGVMAINDHAAEAAVLYARMDSTDGVEFYLETRRALEKTLGHMLVDIVQVCEGLGMMLEEIALDNLETLLRDRRRNAAEEAQQLGVLAQICEMAGKAVKKHE